jgi:hypothetical protein
MKYGGEEMERWSWEVCKRVWREGGSDNSADNKEKVRWDGKRL